MSGIEVAEAAALAITAFYTVGTIPFAIPVIKHALADRRAEKRRRRGGGAP